MDQTVSCCMVVQSFISLKEALWQMEGTERRSLNSVFNVSEVHLALIDPYSILCDFYAIRTLLFAELSSKQTACLLANDPLLWNRMLTVILEIRLYVTAQKPRESWEAIAFLLRHGVIDQYRRIMFHCSVLGQLRPGFLSMDKVSWNCFNMLHSNLSVTMKWIEI